jgi:hypothetical protein
MENRLFQYPKGYVRLRKGMSLDEFVIKAHSNKLLFNCFLNGSEML